MSEGVRIQPRAELRFPPGAAMVVVIDHDRPVLPAIDSEGRLIPLEQTQPVCQICERAQNGHRQHFTKAYHVQLEADGTSIVSTGVWSGLQRCADNPFEAANPVAEPPTQHFMVPAAGVTIRSSLN